MPFNVAINRTYSIRIENLANFEVSTHGCESLPDQSFYEVSHTDWLRIVAATHNELTTSYSGSTK